MNSIREDLLKISHGRNLTSDSEGNTRTRLWLDRDELEEYIEHVMEKGGEMNTKKDKKHKHEYRQTGTVMVNTGEYLSLNYPYGARLEPIKKECLVFICDCGDMLIKDIPDNVNKGDMYEFLDSLKGEK